MKLTVDYSTRLTLTVVECSQILGISPQCVKRRITQGRIKAIHRDNLKEKILVHTSSVKKFLEIE